MLTTRSPILYRVAALLTPAADRRPLPNTIRNYRGIYMYTAIQIISTVAVFVVAQTKAAPVFPIMIIILVPVRLLLMSRFWDRETLRYVDAWACKEGTPEDDEDAELSGQAKDAGKEKHHQNASMKQPRLDIPSGDHV